MNLTASLVALLARNSHPVLALAANGIARDLLEGKLTTAHLMQAEVAQAFPMAAEGWRSWQWDNHGADYRAGLLSKVNAPDWHGSFGWDDLCPAVKAAIRAEML